MTSVRFYFSFRSPFAGIAFCRLNDMRQSLGVELELLPVWPEIIFGGHMDNPTDNLFKLSYVFHDAVRQAREAGLDATNLARIAENIPKPSADEMKKGKAGLALPPEHWEIPHHAFLHAAGEGKAWAFGEAMFNRRFGFDGGPTADIADPQVIAGIATSVGLDGDTAARAFDSHRFDDRMSAVIDQSHADGVFGVPFFAFEKQGDTERFWGNDHIGHLMESLREIEYENENKQGRVVGIGGLFYKSPDPARARDWYRDHLGFNTDQYGTNFEWRQADTGTRKGFSQWAPFKADTEYFDPSDRDYMFNFRVANLDVLLEQLRRDGVEIIGDVASHDYGKFVHIMDCDGNKVELWEPNDAVYQTMTGGHTTK